MATLHVAAGGGALSAAGTYVEGAAPTAGDDIIVDNTSGGTNGSAGNITLTSTNVTCHSLDMSNFTGTFSGTTTRTLTVGGGSTNTAAAVLTLGASMTWNYTGTLTITIDVRSGSGTFAVTTNGKTMTCTLNAGTNANAGGAITLADSCNLNTSGGALVIYRTQVTITSGTTFTAGSVGFGATTGTSSLTWSGATIKVLAWSALSAGATLTLTDSSSSLIDMTAGANQNFGGPLGGSTYLGEVKLPAALTNITGSNTWAKLTVPAGATLNLTAETTQTFSTAAAFNFSGAAGNLITLKPATDVAFNCTISCASQIVTDYLAFQVGGNTHHNTVNGGGAGASHNAGPHSTYDTKPSGWIFPALVTGTATVTNGGTIAATGTRKVLGTTAVTNGFTLAAIGKRTTFGTSAVAGGGTIHAGGTRTTFGVVVVANGFALVVVGKRTVLGTTSFVGGWTLAAAGRLVPPPKMLPGLTAPTEGRSGKTSPKMVYGQTSPKMEH